MNAWETFEFLFRRGLFKQQNLSLCFFRYAQALGELKKKGLIRPATVTASERHWILTDEGREHINTVLGQAGVNVQQLQHRIQDRLEETLKQMSLTGRLVRA
jgi:DNA-binding PadR family transcriptional regulator